MNKITNLIKQAFPSPNASSWGEIDLMQRRWTEMETLAFCGGLLSTYVWALHCRDWRHWFLKLCLASNRIHFPFINTNPSLSLINCDWGLLRKSSPVPKQNAEKRKARLGRGELFSQMTGWELRERSRLERGRVYMWASVWSGGS